MSFDNALALILREEGGFVDDPQDRGGATNRGITQRTYDAWRQAQGVAAQSVRDISDAEVRAIYQANYWAAARCDALPEPLATIHFDAAVNHGPRNAATMLQRALRVTPDGSIGPITLAAAAAVPQDVAGPRYLAVRIRFYAGIVALDASQQKFLNGWLKRMDTLASATGTVFP